MVQRAFTVLFEDNLAIIQGQLVASHLITLSPHFLGWQTMMTNTGIHIGCCQGECNRWNRTTFRANMQTFQPQFLHCIFCHRVFVDILCLAEHKDDIMGLKDWVWFQGLQTRSIVNPISPRSLSLVLNGKKKSTAHPTRGLADDGDNVPESHRRTGSKKKRSPWINVGNDCQLLLCNILQFHHQTVSISGWQLAENTWTLWFPVNRVAFSWIGEYHFVAQWAPQRHVPTHYGILTHHGESIDTGEDLSPTLENTIVVLWLKTIHPGLPQLVKQRYGPELRNKTVASLKPEISLAMSSLLDELKSIEENRVLRAATPFPTRPRSSHPKRTVKSCILCKTANRTGVAPHFLSKCPFLTEADRRFMGRTRLIPGDDDDNFDDPECEFTEDEECALLDTPSARRVAIVQSPYLSCFYNQYPVRVTLDTGATTNLVSQSFATSIDLPIKPASQFARQTDGHTPLDVVGEISCTLHCGDSNFSLDALAVRKLDVDVLAGNPFLTVNDIATCPAKWQVIVGGKDIVSYGAATTRNVSIRRAVLLRAPPKQTVIMPGAYVFTLGQPWECLSQRLVWRSSWVTSLATSSCRVGWPK